MAARRWSGAVVACLLLLLALPLWCVYSETGTRVALQVLQRFSPVALEYGAGTLGGSLTLRTLEVDAGATRINLRNLQFSLDPRCLWRSIVCLDALRVGALDVTAVAAGEGAQSKGEPAPDDASPEPLQFPVAINAPGALIGRTTVNWPGGQWTQDAARFNLRLRDSSLRIAAATISNARLAFATDAAPAPRADALSLPELALPFKLELVGLELTNPVVSLPERDYALERLFLSGRWSGHQLQLSRVELSAPDTGTARLREGRLRFSDQWPLSLEITLQAATALDSPLLQGRSATLGVAGDLRDLALELVSPGAQQLSFTGRLNALDPLLPFSAELLIEGDAPLALGDIPQLPAALADSAIHFPLQLSAGGTVDSQSLKLQMQAATPVYGLIDIDGAAQLDGDTLSVESLSVHDGETDSALQASGEIAWDEGLNWNMQLRSDGVDLPPATPRLTGRLHGSLRSSGDFRDEKLHLSLSEVALSGQVNGLPARLSGEVALADGTLLPHSELRAQLNEASLKLTPLDGGNLIELNIEDLGNWLPDTGGSLSAQATLRDDSAHIALRGEASALRWQELHAAGGTFEGELARNANHAFSGLIRLTQVRRGEHTLDSLTLTAQGDAARQSLLLESRGFVRGELSVRGTAQGSTWQGRLAPTALSIGAQHWTLERPVELRWSDERLQVGGHCWRHDAAQLCPGYWTLGRSGGGELAFEGELGLFSALLPGEASLAGDLAGSGDIAWTEGAGIQAGAELRSGPLGITRNLAEGEIMQLRARSLHAEARFTDGAITLAGALLPESGGEVSLDLQMPPARDAPLAGELRIDSIRLQGFATLLPQLAQLAGRLDGTLRLSGTADKPLTHGRLQLSDGIVALPATPTRLENLDMQIDASGNALTLSATGRLGDGPVSLRGTLSTAEQLTLSLQLKGDNNTLLYPPATTLRLSPDLDIRATTERVGISGNITVHGGKIRLQELPEGGVELSADVVQVDSEGQAISEQIPLTIDTNVRVRVEEGLRVTGSMLETALSGDLQLRQRSREPLQVFGSLETLGGQVTAYERVLQIQRGVISFSGAPDNPLLDVRAERRIAGENISAGIHVHGELARDLQLDVYSEPPMSQGDAMSYLIWGRSLDSGTNTDGAVLALSLASTVVNSSGLVQTINRVPGISRVSFGAEGSESDAAATVSGYVGERLYLSYGFGLYEPVNVLTARLFLQTRLWLEVVSRLENSLDLYYSFDID